MKLVYHFSVAVPRHKNDIRTLLVNGGHSRTYALLGALVFSFSCYACRNGC